MAKKPAKPVGDDPIKQDFRKFLYLVWKHLRLPKPTPRQTAIARYLQTGPDRRMVQAFRGVGKSWITAAFVLWVLYCDPNKRIVVVSASKIRADNFTTFCLQLIREMPILAHLEPREDQRCSRTCFDVAPSASDQQPSLVSMGITSALTGNRADLIVSDDVEIVNNSATQQMREKLGEAVKEYDAILKPGGQVVFLGTPQSQESVYNQLEARGYEIKIWPAEYPTDRQRDAYGKRLADDIVADMAAGKQPGDPTEPSRFSKEDLYARRMSYGAAGYALQFMLDTSLSDIDRFPLKLKDLLVWPATNAGVPEKLVWEPVDSNRTQLPNMGFGFDRIYMATKPENVAYREFTGVCMAIDPGGQGADETAYAVVAHLNGYLWLVDSGAVKGYSPEALEVLAKVAAKHKATKVLVESNLGLGMFVELLKPFLAKAGIPFSGIEEVRHNTQKEMRICDALEPVMSTHRLVVNSTLFQQDLESIQHYPSEEAVYYSLFYQLTRMTRDRGAVRHDDRADALAMAVQYWARTLAVDHDRAIQSQQERDKLKVLEKFAQWHRSRGYTHKDFKKPNRIDARWV